LAYCISSIVLHGFEYTIPLDYSCGSTLGKICPCVYSDSEYFVIFGDLINYEFFSCVKFNLNKFDKEIKIPFEQDFEPEFEQVFLISVEKKTNENMMIFSKAFAHSTNQIEIGLFHVNDSTCFSVSTFVLPDNLIHDSTKPIEVECKMCDSIIYDFFQFESKLYCLIRIKLAQRIDPLHIKPYFIDVIVHIDGSKSTIKCYSQPIFYNLDSDFSDNFGIKPYWIKIFDSDGKKHIDIFNELKIKN
jgi:hypothetical protein